MKKIFKITYTFINGSFEFISYLVLLIYKGQLKNPFRKSFSGTAAVLANGPSMKEILPRITTDEEFKNIDFVVLNFFAFDTSFHELKPKHYCLADPMFFFESHNKDKVKKLYKTLNSVNWEINVYIPSYLFKQFVGFSKLNNNYIKIIKVNAVEYKGYEILRNYFYKKGWATPGWFTVAILAIYISINNGYTDIKLYGVDHTFFDDLAVNSSNQLCSVEKHFYDTQEQQLKPIIRNDNGKIWKIADYLEFMTSIFKSHELLEKYSNYMSCKIINCTKISLIDSYVRSN